MKNNPASSDFPIPSQAIHEIIRAPKVLAPGEKPLVAHKGRGGEMNVNLRLRENHLYPLRYLSKTYDLTEVTGYQANLLLAGQRVRSVHHEAVGRKHFYKNRIPAGWHQNVVDPNLSTTSPDFNRHEPLPDFAPTDFMDFLQKTSAMWSIDMALESPML